MPSENREYHDLLAKSEMEMYDFINIKVSSRCIYGGISFSFTVLTVHSAVNVNSILLTREIKFTSVASI